MRFAFVNPNWDFAGSTYFGCHEPHLPLELLFAEQQTAAAGHDTLLIDAHLERLTIAETKRRLTTFYPDFLIIPTTNSYLFWRCPQPELRIPQAWFAGLGKGAVKVAIGPHGSATPSAALRKLKADVVLRGEPDTNISLLADRPWREIDGCCWRDENGEHITESLGVTHMKSLAALDFTGYPLELRTHRHHVFHGQGRGIELEFARGCPWACTFCNKTLFRNTFRERDVEAVLAEVDAAVAAGIDYVYFIDEIFGVGKNVRRLLEGLAGRNITFGCQTRIDLWDEESLDLLGRAHCISMECGVESITAEGRDALNKNCRIGTERISDLLLHARQRVPWVQANLILTDTDDRNHIGTWQETLRNKGVWVSEPVPMFPFPGSPLYRQTFGSAPDELAWERAHQYYLESFASKGYSDIQDQSPRALKDLECTSS